MIVSSNVVCFCDLVCQEYANLPYGIVNLANNHGTVVGVQYNAGIGTTRAVYSINLATEGNQYYFVYLNDIKCTLRCCLLQHRMILQQASKQTCLLLLALGINLNIVNLLVIFSAMKMIILYFVYKQNHSN